MVVVTILIKSLMHTTLEFVMYPTRISFMEQIPEKIQVDTAGESLVPFAA